MLVFPNSKINLGLHVVHKRADGFHDIETCFYPITLTDALEALPTTERTSFALTGLMVTDGGADNLCMKAYRLLKKHYEQIGNVKMHLHKVIPAQAGLGGGSADAAFTIRLLNDLFGLQMSTEEMQHYARQLGSDCAFFIENRPTYATEKGDTFEDFDIDLSKYKIVVVKPNIAISTKDAYDAIIPKEPANKLKEILAKPIAEWRNLLVNDFETALVPTYPKLFEIKQQLYASGAIYASMSGSGSALYGIFEHNYNIDFETTFLDCFCWKSA